ncbi:MAG TPA: hypothetical protein PK006_11990 [Saprospiraceae bacterium]|nr:hypothetical protein [Saprospiraceae bacterium]
MKNTFSMFLLISLIYCCLSCTDSESSQVVPVIPPCLQAKINSLEGKNEFLYRLYELKTQNGILYWLNNDSIADEIESIFDSDCNVVCITDCECTSNNQCETWVTTSPRSLLWKNK